MKLEPGMLIETNYSGPYRIKSIERGCTCSAYDIGRGKPPPRPEHIHLILSSPDGNGKFYLNGYNEETLKSWDMSWNEKEELEPDYITILKQDKPIQSTFF